MSKPKIRFSRLSEGAYLTFDASFTFSIELDCNCLLRDEDSRCPFKLLFLLFPNKLPLLLPLLRGLCSILPLSVRNKVICGYDCYSIRSSYLSISFL